MHKYTKKQMESIEKMLKWFQSKYKTEFQKDEDIKSKWVNDMSEGKLIRRM
jgi:hypothetical protein